MDGNEFVITGDGKNTGTINGFPVTKEQWQTVLKGTPVTLTSAGKKITITSVKGNIKIDGKSITHYARSGGEGSSTTTISSRSNPQVQTDNTGLDFTTTTWMTEFQTSQTVTLTVDENKFVITYDGTTIYINDFPVTEEEWIQVLNGKTVTLTNENKDTITVTKKGEIIYFDGKPFTGGKKISVQVSFGLPGSTGLPAPVTGDLKLFHNEVEHFYLFIFYS